MIDCIKNFISYNGGRDVDITWRDFSVDFFWVSQAGLVSVSWGRWSLHVGVQPSHWAWGHQYEMPDYCIDTWGFGPLFLLARLN